MHVARQLTKILNDAKGDLTDKEVFCSRFFEDYLMDAGRFTASRFGIVYRLQMKWNVKLYDFLADTDGYTIRINAGCKDVQVIHSRKERFEIICGLFTHELGHLLFTNFKLWNEYTSKLEQGAWFPTAPDVSLDATMQANKTEIEAYIANKRQAEMLSKVVHDIHNIIEDGRIEELLYDTCKGSLISGLSLLRELMFNDCPSSHEMHEMVTNKTLNFFDAVRNNLLIFSKYGKFKGLVPATTPSEEIPEVAAVLRVMQYVKSAISTTSALSQIENINLIIIGLWPEIRSYLETIKADNVDKPNKTVDVNRLPQEEMDKLLDIISINLAEALFGGSEDGENRDTIGLPEELILRIIMDAAKESDDGTLVCPESVKNRSEIKGDDSPVPPNENGRIPYTETEDIEEGSGYGSCTYDSDYRAEIYSGAGYDLDQLLHQIAEENIDSKDESTMMETLKGEVTQNRHSRVSMGIHRPRTVNNDLITLYRDHAAPYEEIAKQAAKKIAPLFEREDEEITTKHFTGSKFNASSLCKSDLRYFSRVKDPSDIPSVAIALRIDESGSMKSDNRITYARAAAITLYKMCEELNIPIAIYGDSADEKYKNGEDVSMYCYCDFTHKFKTDKYRLMGIKARFNNRDGASIRFISDRLMSQPAETKLMIILSDGQPHAKGYSRKAGEQDLANIVKEYSKQGVTFLAAAIGSDKEDIKRIYGADKFLDITDLKMLPTTLATIVRKKIR